MNTHSEKLRVRWVDTDASGRIHYTAAFRYFETAEWEFFRRLGIPLRGHEKAFGFPRVSVSATFHVPLYADDEIVVHIRPERVGSTSITFALEIFRDETLGISGTVTAVFIGDEGRPIPIPAAIRQALATST
jgi:YbgC/YbaW family acyl-CoA thioester hydrolase